MSAKLVHVVSTHLPGCLNDYQAAFADRKSALEDFQEMIEDWKQNEENAKVSYFAIAKHHSVAEVTYGNYGATVIIERQAVPWTALGTETYSEALELD